MCIRDSVLGGGAAEDADRERSHHLAGVDDGAHLDARNGAAVMDGDDRILRDVDETTRQISRIGGLQRGVREALAGAVGGDAVSYTHLDVYKRQQLAMLLEGLEWRRVRESFKPHLAV